MLPYAVGLLAVPPLAAGLREPDRIGLAAVAIAPALLAGPALAGRIRGRMDRIGALLAGSIGLSFVIALVRGGGMAAAGQSAMLAFVVGAGITSALPNVPTTVRTAGRLLGDGAFAALLAIAVVRFDELGSATLAATVVLFAATVGTAAAVGRIGGLDLRSALAGAGTRDPAAATALALAGGGATVVPAVFAVLLALLLGALALPNTRKPR
ncbi:MAG TPA: hypothetical protein VGT60_00895 [Candidatus Limnocylindria bacterium]|nr:hypothetical protein [Candidatus Limnocylindria bacterium]